MSVHDERASELHKRATASKKAGDWDAAIATLKEAYEEMRLGALSYTVDQYLRLPQFLHQAGKPEEAWKELNRLLFYGYPKQKFSPLTWPMERQQIFDKMSLFLGRCGRHAQAALYAHFGDVSWAIGLFRQERIIGMAGFFEQESVDNMLVALRASRANGVIAELCRVVVEEFEVFPSVNSERLGRRFDAVLAGQRSPRRV